jgi:hypothetical protein
MCAAVIGLWSAIRVRANAGTYPVTYLTSWSPKAAANYLDRREVWWQGWPPAQMDHGTICISCHTVVPYVMVRSTLQNELRETTIAAPESVLMGSVEKRVSDWREVTPFYTDGPALTEGSRATEAVLNAVILTSMDAEAGQLRPITRTALEEAWALQEQTGEEAGGWKWQDFQLAPWESAESPYQGAALLMLEVENAPDGYANEPEILGNMERLRGYLRDHYEEQPLLNRLYILWLSVQVPGLLSEPQKNTLLAAIRQDRQADGGWALSSLDPQEREGNRQWWQFKQQLMNIARPAKSDGYATGLVVLVLERSGMTREDETLSHGLDWLERHQVNDGSWQAFSLNGQRDPRSDVGRFMSDAATAYAVMALENGPSQALQK